MRRTTIALAITFAVVGPISVEQTAYGDPDVREQCASAAENAQRLRDEGRYRGARDQLLSCTRSACPAPVRKDCNGWLSDVERDAPTVVFSAKDARGQDVVDVTVSMDGEALSSRIDGRPMMVDTGEHLFAFRFPDGAAKEQRIVLHAAEKSRGVVARLDPTADTAPKAESSRLVLPMIAAGVGVLALGGFAFFGLGGKSGYDDLERCKPHCTQSSVDSVDTKFLLADISLGVAVVALASATYLYLTRGTPTRATLAGGGALNVTF